jgi:hypothetical protein
VSIGALTKPNATARLSTSEWPLTSTMLDELGDQRAAVCNQIEVHPFINQDKVLAASRSTAWRW